ncbi:hypothetical protein J5N97_007876 [Dioscorea zingiberensis]|uniref:Uncharacterized protein n=1 Tax=Dioscorea zingiberensis TaxID=325984 RepID=A0A9D5HU29_9LILI|nr:hypothetical protein J5N97_007876 [Dioscorea zingiberensis]
MRSFQQGLDLLTNGEGFIASASAGVVVETALYPIDTIKTWLQHEMQSTRNKGLALMESPNSSILHCISFTKHEQKCRFC